MSEHERLNDGVPVRDTGTAHEEVDPAEPRPRRSRGAGWIIGAAIVVVAVAWALWALLG